MAKSETVKNKNDKLAELTRAQAKRQEHEKKTKERLDNLREIRNAFRLASKNDSLVLESIVSHAEKLISYNEKIARDGVGARKTGHLLENGSEEVENIFLKPAERISYLDKAAGIQLLVDYIKRQIEDSVVSKS